MHSREEKADRSVRNARHREGGNAWRNPDRDGERTGPSPGRGLGNQAIQELVERGALRAKLTVSRPADEAEREAERVAEAMVPPSGRDRPGSRAEAHASIAPGDHIGIGPPFRSTLQNPEDGSVAVDRPRLSVDRPRLSVDRPGHVRRGGGHPLSESVRSFFEPRFGVDLGAVRVHTDGDAAAMTAAINATAFTYGSDVFFGTTYRPGTTAGKKLLAHELTHVVQQAGNVRGSPPVRGTLHRQRAPLLEPGEIPLPKSPSDFAELFASKHPKYGWVASIVGGVRDVITSDDPIAASEGAISTLEGVASGAETVGNRARSLRLLRFAEKLKTGLIYTNLLTIPWEVFKILGVPYAEAWDENEAAGKKWAFSITLTALSMGKDVRWVISKFAPRMPDERLGKRAYQEGFKSGIKVGYETYTSNLSPEKWRYVMLAAGTWMSKTDLYHLRTARNDRGIVLAFARPLQRILEAKRKAAERERKEAERARREAILERERERRHGTITGRIMN